jgi:hypothetical protein
VKKVQGSKVLDHVIFPLQTARYLKVVLTESSPHWWSIADLQVLAPDNGSDVEKGKPLVIDCEAMTVTVTGSTYGNLSLLNMLDADNHTYCAVPALGR